MHADVAIVEVLNMWPCKKLTEPSHPGQHVYSGYPLSGKEG